MQLVRHLWIPCWTLEATAAHQLKRRRKLQALIRRPKLKDILSRTIASHSWYMIHYDSRCLTYSVSTFLHSMSYRLVTWHLKLPQVTSGFWRCTWMELNWTFCKVYFYWLYLIIYRLSIFRQLQEAVVSHSTITGGSICLNIICSILECTKPTYCLSEC